QGASVAFFHGDTILAFTAAASDARAPDRARITAGLASARRDPALAEQERTQPLALGDDALAVFALFRGKPIEGTVGYAVARALPAATSPAALISSAPADDVAQVPWLIVVLVPLLLAGL